MFFVLSQAWNKEKILSPHEDNHTLTTEPQKLRGERGLLRSSYKSVLHTAKISNVYAFFEFLIFAFQVANFQIFIDTFMVFLNV